MDVGSRQSRVAREIHIHPSFEEIKISEADISLVKVDDFEITPTVSPIPISGKPFAINTDVPCKASGWGDTVFSKSNSRLHSLNVIAVQSKKVCHGLSPKERRNMLCLRANSGKGLCDGDSGGPLICNDELVGVAHQVYIEKSNYKGPQDMDCGSDTIIHTYMYTCPFLNWIRSYVPEVPLKPSKCFTMDITN
ncbi:kallikrein-12-like isoform X2 [Rhodnius prolixus]